jgi:hypothetical protein
VFPASGQARYINGVLLEVDTGLQYRGGRTGLVTIKFLKSKYLFDE